MRIGQLARKHDIPVQEIIDFLQEQTGEKFHPNAKLYDGIEGLLYDQFNLYPIQESKKDEEEPVGHTKEVTDEMVIEEPAAEKEIVPELPATPEEDIASVDGELAAFMAQQELDEIPAPSESNDKPQPKEDEVILSDQLLEMLESEDMPADLERIKLIKAPKKKLSGLKVLDKIELPEDPRKKAKEKAEQERQAREMENAGRRPQLSDEEKEKRRLKAKRKKEAFEARQEKRKKEQEAQRLKELRAAHYKQKLEAAKTPSHKKRAPKEDIQRDLPKIPEKSAPKTWLGKWWRWMNT